jgi:hypothetical protein
MYYCTITKYSWSRERCVQDGVRRSCMVVTLNSLPAGKRALSLAWLQCGRPHCITRRCRSTFSRGMLECFWTTDLSRTTLLETATVPRLNEGMGFHSGQETRPMRGTRREFEDGVEDEVRRGEEQMNPFLVHGEERRMRGSVRVSNKRRSLSVFSNLSYRTVYRCFIYSSATLLCSRPSSNDSCTSAPIWRQVWWARR